MMLERLDGKPTVYAMCECGEEIVHVKDEFWALARNGREVCTNNHWHKPKKAEEENAHQSQVS